MPAAPCRRSSPADGSRILALAQSAESRQAALDRYMVLEFLPDERVDHGKYLVILAEAVRARDGWQRIRRRCAP